MSRNLKNPARCLSVCLGAGAVSLFFSVVPFSVDLANFETSLQSAHAKPGNGNGNGNGNGGQGAGGNSNGGGHGAANADTGGSGVGRGRGKSDERSGRSHKGHDKSRSGKSASGKSGSGRSRGRASGHAKDAVSGVPEHKGHAARHGKNAGYSTSQNGLTASSLGRLNAAHASERARERAAPHSAVGLIGQFSEAERAAIEAAIDQDQERYDSKISEASKALAAAANKPINDDVVAAVNDLLGIDVEGALEGTPGEGTDVEGDIADQAAEAQADKPNNGLGGQKDLGDDH